MCVRVFVIYGVIEHRNDSTAAEPISTSRALETVPLYTGHKSDRSRLIDNCSLAVYTAVYLRPTGCNKAAIYVQE